MKTIKLHTACIAAALLAAWAGSAGCKQAGGYEGMKPAQPCDPSQPVVFNDYTPKEGTVRTTMFIEGSNFGTDISKIAVTIGGKEAPVIGSSGSKICAMVPKRCAAGDGRVVITDAAGQTAADYLFDDRFTLHSSLQVGTLVGNVDPLTGTSAMNDGAFEEAGFNAPFWLMLDRDDQGHKVIYCSDEERMTALRKIDLTDRTVSTVFTKGQAGFKGVESFVLDGPSRDTMFFIDDNGKGSIADRFTYPNMFYSLRSEGFRKVYPYMSWTCSYSAVSMNDGSIFFCTWTSSLVYKARGAGYNEAAKMWEAQELFSIRANDQNHGYMIKHPDDLYVYISAFNGIYKCLYDKNSKLLTSSVIFAGDLNGGWGYNDATGTAARLDTPRQGVFVKNQEYVDQGKEDVYDFFACDRNNNCIRRITPEGTVSTFAGRGNYTQNTSGEDYAKGWVDGGARETALFYCPTGICYDEEEGVFYVADHKNKRIRTISIE
jgi:hypothetical protein